MLLALPCSPCQKTITEIYTPLSHRDDSSVHCCWFWNSNAMLPSCSLAVSGMCCFLQGGIVGRIEKEYLSVNGVLAGPSLEFTGHHVGYLGSSGTNGILYCDDELMENEIAAICWTYTLYMGKLVFLLYIVLSFDIFYRPWGSRSCMVLVSSSCLLECCSYWTQVNWLDGVMQNLVSKTYGKHLWR